MEVTKVTAQTPLLYNQTSVILKVHSVFRLIKHVFSYITHNVCSRQTAVEKIPEHIQKPLWDDDKLEKSGQ